MLSLGASCSDSLLAMLDLSSPTATALSLLEEGGLVSPDYHYQTRLVAAFGNPQRFVAVEAYLDRALSIQYPFHYFLVDTLRREAYYASYLVSEPETLTHIDNRMLPPVIQAKR